MNLVSLRNILAREYGVKFPLFNIALDNYALKIGENVPSSERPGFVDKFPILASACDLLQELPSLDKIPKLVMAFDRGVAKIRSMLADRKRSQYAIENSTPADLYQQLPLIFAKDVAGHLAKTREPFVFFFDSYERLVNEMTDIGESLNRYQEAFGEDNIALETAIHYLAISYSHSGRYEMALSCLRTVLDLSEKIFGTDHPKTIAVRNNLANVYRKAG